MKAFLLAAGKGTRLKPITLNIPKCLVPICGRPLIEYWFDLFRKYGVKEILINTSHLSEQVKKYVDHHSEGLEITVTYEETLLGSGGTVKKNWNFVKREDSFYVLYADNLTNMNLKELMNFHCAHKKDHTLALYKVSNPHECGIVELDDQKTVTAFTEKPDNPVSDLAFAGIMISNQTLRDFFPENDVFDLGFDVLPRISGKAAGYVINEYLLDIGSPDKLEQAEEDVRIKNMLIR